MFGDFDRPLTKRVARVRQHQLSFLFAVLAITVYIMLLFSCSVVVQVQIVEFVSGRYVLLRQRSRILRLIDISQTLIDVRVVKLRTVERQRRSVMAD